MKKLALIILVSIIASCNSAKETANTTTKVENKEPAKPNKELIAGSWALVNINNENIEEPKEGNKIAELIIYPEKMQIAGTDGCNRINGGIKMIDEKSIIFSQMISTKMMCPDMKIADRFTKLITQVVAYNIIENKLFLYNKENIEVLQFRKK